MGKINTLLNPLVGKETGFILIADLHPDVVSQRRAHTHTPFWATLPDHIPSPWKARHGTREEAVRASQQSPKPISPRAARQVEVKSESPGQQGAVGEGGAGVRRGRLGQTGLTPDWLERLWRKSELPLASRELSNFSAAQRSGFGAPGRRRLTPRTLPRLQLQTIPALAAGAQRKERKKKGREESAPDPWSSRAPRVPALVTPAALEHLSATTAAVKEPGHICDPSC